MSFNFRTDDYIIASMSALLVQAIAPLWEIAERRNCVPRLVEPARQLWREDKIKWLATVLPAFILGTFAVWFCLRSIIAENEKQTTWYLAGICLVSLAVSIFRWLLSHQQVEEQVSNAMQQLKLAEEELKKIADGPLVEDEQLDRRILTLKQKVLEAREKLGMPDRDPNDR